VLRKAAYTICPISPEPFKTILNSNGCHQHLGPDLLSLLCLLSFGKSGWHHQNWLIRVLQMDW
jgi:hypothetical protein